LFPEDTGDAHSFDERGRLEAAFPVGISGFEELKKQLSEAESSIECCCRGFLRGRREERRHTADEESRVTQLKPTLYADQPLGQTIGGELLLGIGRRQVAEMLDDRCLAALEIRQAPLDLSKRPLDVGDIGTNGA
jgi:hypothetical protein